MPEDITTLLDAVADGQDEAWEKLIPAVYLEIKKRAKSALRGERPDHTLQSTELVHELFMRLVNREDAKWENREHFYRAAAIAFNWILVDYARHRNRESGPGEKIHVPLEKASEEFDGRKYSKKLEVLDIALKRLDGDASMKRKCQVLNMRFFSGMTHQEIAKTLGISVNTAKNDWQFARAWLLREIKKIESYAV